MVSVFGVVVVMSVMAYSYSYVLLIIRATIARVEHGVEHILPLEYIVRVGRRVASAASGVRVGYACVGPGVRGSVHQDSRHYTTTTTTLSSSMTGRQRRRGVSRQGRRQIQNGHVPNGIGFLRTVAAMDQQIAVTCEVGGRKGKSGFGQRALYLRA
jgi:hypothetical protein